MMYSLLSLSLVLVALNAQTSTTRPNPVTTTVKATTSTAAAPTTAAPTTPAPIIPISDPVSITPPSPVTTAANSGNSNPAVVTPVPPTNPNPPQQPPVTPQQPPATPQFGPQTQRGYNPYGPFMPGMVDPQTLKCEFGQCINRRITMTPGQGFKLECNMAFQCNGLDLTLNIGIDPTNFGSGVNEINDLNFDAPQNGVTVRMNNMFPGNNIEVNNINCKVPMACNNLRILAGFGVELWEINVKCEMPGACNGCTINGQSCAMISMMTGNNNGYMPYGFGYMNTPNTPQQPGVGAPGSAMPQQGAPQYQYPQYQQPMYPGWI